MNDTNGAQEAYNVNDQLSPYEDDMLNEDEQHSNGSWWKWGVLIVCLVYAVVMVIKMVL